MEHTTKSLWRDQLIAARRSIVHGRDLICEAASGEIEGEDELWDHQTAVTLDELAGSCDEMVRTIDALLRARPSG